MTETDATADVGPQESPSEVVNLDWFRRDLRMHDHQALNAGALAGKVVAVFIWSPEEEVCKLASIKLEGSFGVQARLIRQRVSGILSTWQRKLLVASRGTQEVEDRFSQEGYHSGLAQRNRGLARAVGSCGGYGGHERVL